MLREYFTVEQIKEQVPGATMYILMNAPGTKFIYLHCSEPNPEGKWCLLGIWD